MEPVGTIDLAAGVFEDRDGAAGERPLPGYPGNLLLCERNLSHRSPLPDCARPLNDQAYEHR
jgi:hypothetical protein